MKQSITVDVMSKKNLHDKELLEKMYEKMLLIRIFEDTLYELYLREPMPGAMHQCTGQEAVAVGVCENLRTDDYVTSTHRGHGHYIAKGGNIDKLMAEMFAKETGCCKGMGGSLHVADYSVGMLGATGIVGAGIPIATGAGLSIKLRRTDQVVACFFGDGASNQGTFHEGVNMAAIWKLPIIFICENNLYGVSTHIATVLPVSNISDRATAYGIPGITVDGNDVVSVYEVAKNAVNRARKGEGPSLIECKTYRYRGHSRFDPASYRPKEEIEEWHKKDSIQRFKDYLIANKIAEESGLKSIEEGVRNTIENAVKFSKESPEPPQELSLKYSYA